MKIKKIIKLLECIEGDYEGNLPQDMYDLGSYTRANDSRMGIDDMDFVHVMRAFKKMQSILAEEYDVGLQASVSQTNQIMKLEQEVSHLRERVKNLNKQNQALQDLNIQMKERNQDLHKRLEEKSYTEVTAPRYVFSEIPRNMYGEAFVDALKKYLNKSRYSMRVRGQHIKEELKGKGLTSYGQSIDESTHLRVYIEEK